MTAQQSKGAAALLAPWTGPHGGLPPLADVSPADIEEVLNLRSAGLSQAAIAKKFNVTQTCISRVLLRTFSRNAEA